MPTVEQLRQAGADPFAILHRFWDSQHEYLLGNEDDPIEPYQNVDLVFTVICEVWRPGISDDEWFATVVNQLEVMP
jgi:hypothetical protein